MERRKFLKSTVATTAGAIIIPSIVPSSVFGANAPSNKINVGQIGCGRIAVTHDNDFAEASNRIIEMADGKLIQNA